MDLGLSGRTALVCGASSGLGLASAEALAEEGANVVLLARRAEQLDEHAARLNGAAVAGDVNDDGDLEQAVSTAVERFGGLDVLVWNGGGPPPGTARDVDEASLESAFQLLWVVGALWPVLIGIDAEPGYVIIAVITGAAMVAYVVARSKPVVATA